MTNERLLKIEREIAENVGWLENGKEVRLSNAAISTIMAIIRVNLEEDAKSTLCPAGIHSDDVNCECSG